MSKRSQIIVRQTGNLPPAPTGQDPEVERTIFLYRDTDSDPGLMAGAFYEAFLSAVRPVYRVLGEDGQPAPEDYSMYAAQADYAASFLCAALPGQIVPRHDKVLYPWVDFLYVVDVGEGWDPHRPVWTVSYYTCGKAYSKDPSLETAAVKAKQMGLSAFLKQYRKGGK